MIGYETDPDIANHYLALVTQKALDWRDEAGIHPDAVIGKASGASVAAVIMLLTSFYLKHITFVDRGWKKIPQANYPMSLTTWKPVSELVEAICEMTDLPSSDVEAALDLLIVDSSHASFFEKTGTPVIPMLIRISKEYVLSPVSSIFVNPFEGARMLGTFRHGAADASIRSPREEWMISELTHLFLGNRHRLVSQPVRLKEKGRIVTDIDAAIFDVTTGDLALFQLKWQDFGSHELRSQKSKAKNFVDQVDGWAEKVGLWIDRHGTGELCQSLQLSIAPQTSVRTVSYFAIGRLASRFQRYGYALKAENVASCSWPRFARLRLEIGSVDNVIQSMHERIHAEQVIPLKAVPLAHVLEVDGETICFEDIWKLIVVEDEDRNDCSF